MPRLGTLSPASAALSDGRAGGKAVGEVAAGQHGAVGALRLRRVDAVEIGLAAARCERSRMRSVMASMSCLAVMASVLLGERELGRRPRLQRLRRPEDLDRRCRRLPQHGARSACRRRSVASAPVERRASCPRPRYAGRAARRRAGARSVSVSRGSPAPGACIGSTIRLGVRVERVGQVVAAGKERGGVAVGAHAEDGDVERPGQAHAVPRRRQGGRILGVGRPRDRAARSAPPRRRSAAGLPCTSAAFERGECRGTKRSSTSVTVTLSQSIGLLRQRREEPRRRGAAGNGERGRAARGDRRRAECSATVVGQRLRQARCASAKSCQSELPAHRVSCSRARCGRRARSARSRPVGPQVPAV